MSNNLTYKLILWLTMGACVSANAQSLQSQVWSSASLGYLSGVQMLNFLSAQAKNNDRIETAATPNYFMSCSYFVRPHLALGLAVGMQSLSGHSNPDRLGASSPYSYNQDYLTIGAEAVVVQRQRKYLQLYSLYGLALSYAKTRYNYSYPAFQDGPQYKTAYYPNIQLTPIGLRVGRALSGFLEVGVGYKGFLNAGISYSISAREEVKVVGGE